MHRELWKSVPIKHTYLGLYDGPHATPKEAADGPIFLGIRNLTEDGHLDLSEIRHIAEEDFPAWTRRVLPRPGDIVFCYEAALNRYAIIPDGFRGCLGRRLALIRPNPQVVDTRFLFFSFFSPEWRKTIATRMLPGTTVDRIPLISFPDFPITLPPLPLQRTIGGILSAYHDLIDNNTRRIANLEARARLLYDEWFVKFRFPGHERVRLVESAVGMVPEGWEVVKLGEIAQELRRTVYPASVDPEIPYVGLEHLPRRSIALTAWGTAQSVQSTKLWFEKGEILFGKIRPNLHKVCIAPFRGICSSDTIVIVPKQEEYQALVLYHVSGEDFVGFASRTANGTNMPRASWEVLATRSLALPPQPVLAPFNEFVKSAIEEIANCLLRNAILRQTRDRLLPGLVAGEIDVTGWNAGEAREMVSVLARRVAEAAGPVEPVGREGMEWESLWE